MQPPGFLPLVALALVVSFIVYGPSLNHDWLSDDRALVQDNLTLRQESPGTLGRIWTMDYWEELGADGKMYRAGADRNLYRPVTITSFWLDARLGATTPSRFRLTNLLLHALAAALIGALAGHRVAPRAAWIALAATVAHPVALDVINRLVGRSDLLVLAGMSLALLAQTRMTEGRRPIHLVLIALGAIVAIGAKESGFAVVPLAAAMAWLDRNKEPRWWVAPAVVSAVAAVFVAARLAVVGLPHYVPDVRMDLLSNPLAGLSLAERLPAALSNAAWYMRMLALPWPMKAIERPLATPGFISMETWLGAVILAGIVVQAVLTFRRKDERFLPSVWWLACYLVVGQLLLPIGAYRETRLVYPFLGGLALGVAWIAASASARLKSANTNQRARLVVPALLGITWLIIIALRTPSYADDRRLLEADLAHHPAPLTWLQLGTIYIEAGRTNDARAAKEKALALAPDSPQALTDAGAFYVDTDSFARGDSLLTRSLAIAPRNSVALLNLGTLRLRQNRLDESHDLLIRSEALDPDFILTQLNLTLLEMRMGRMDSARRRLEKLRVQAPGDPRVAELMRGLGR